jgi:peptidoglycan-associated lipoprotein
MPIKFLSIAAALLLVAACATESTDEGKTAGAGGSKSNAASSSSAGSVSTVSAPTAGSAEEFITIGDRVYFDFDKAEVRTSDAATLNDQAAWLKKYPNITIVVEGHCDERGTREYNLALGERRANAVKEYLMSRGISANRVQTISYGKERPAVLGSNESAWQQNRRGVSIVKGGAS